jgi:glycosyltransferase involved in cell wall biosynthesis
VYTAAGVVLAPVPFTRPLDPMSLRALTALIRRERFDIVHSMGLRADVYARLASRLAGGPRVVSTVAMFASGFDTASWRRYLYAAAERATGRWVDLFFTDSEYARQRLIASSAVAAGRVRTVYIGADADAHDPARTDGRRVRDELRLGSAPVVASLGRLVGQKGHDDFLAAVAIAAQRIPGLQALVIGNGPLAGPLRDRAAQLGLGGCVRFIPARTDLDDVLAAIDVVVLASHVESIPLLLYEAMALGRPIVATAVGGIPEVVTDGQHALVVPPHRPESLAEAMQELLKDAAAAGEMGRRARARVRESFHVRGCVATVAAAYRELRGRSW